MKTFNPSESELPNLRKAATALKEANADIGVANKRVEAAKESLSKWLKEERKLDIETLPIGELVSIEGVLLIEIAKQNKFDEKAFIAADPKRHAEFKKDFPVRKFKPLV